jgi:hypothetical protein
MMAQGDRIAALIVGQIARETGFSGSGTAPKP